MTLLLHPAFPPVHPVSELGGAVAPSPRHHPVQWWWDKPRFRAMVAQAGEWWSCPASTKAKLKALLTSLGFFLL